MDNISDKNEKEEYSLKIEDIKKLWKKNFIDLSKLESSFDIINWKDKLSSDIKCIGKLFNFYLFEFNKMFLIGFYNSPAKSWYKIKSICDIHTFLSYFQENKKEISEKQEKQDEQIKQFTLFLTSKFNFKQLIKYFYFHNFVDKRIYSDNDKIEIKNIKLQDEVLLFDRFLETVTDNSHIIFTTKYSYSKLILSYNNNGYYVKILYKPFKLNNRFKILAKDVPTDIDIILLNLNIIRAKDILEHMETIEENDIDVLFDINSNDNDNLLLLMESIVEVRPELKSYITKKISLIDMDVTLNKMVKDGIFKAFENSLDILLKTIYERFNDSEYDQSENMLELNKKLKDKISKIFESKILL
jgi:hypothetical protein